MKLSSMEGAISPFSEQLLDPSPGHETGDYRFDGHFYQTVDDEEYARRQSEVNKYIDGGIPSMPLDVYQQWVELDWKQPQGTYTAVLRWRDKLEEEATRETPDALYEYAANQDTTSREAAIDELGDTLWATCALTSNAGLSADQATQSYLWGDGLISHREPRLTLGQIDEIAGDITNTPWFTPLDSIDPEENIEFIKYDEMEPERNLFYRSMSLIFLCEKQFGHGEQDGFTLGWYQMIGQNEIAPRAADHIMTIAWYACHFAGSSLSEVAETNIHKIRKRVAANLIDKEDGDRSKLAGK
jgi:hypothetical protein